MLRIRDVFISTNIFTKLESEIVKNGIFVSFVIVFVSSVLSVFGGSIIKTFFGILSSSFWKRFGSRRYLISLVIFFFVSS